MNKEISRRTLLRLMGGASLAAALNFFYPGISTATNIGSSEIESIASEPGTNTKTMEGLDPTYAGGNVVAKNSDGIILKSASGVRGVRVPADTVVWKEFDVTPDAIELGDWVDVKGSLLKDGTLLAKSGWIFVNISRLDGSIHQVSEASNTAKENSTLIINTARGQKSIELSQRLEVIGFNDGLPLSAHISALTTGSEIGCVGLSLPNGGFRATRIWLY